MEADASIHYGSLRIHQNGTFKHAASGVNDSLALNAVPAYRKRDRRREEGVGENDNKHCEQQPRWQVVCSKPPYDKLGHPQYVGEVLAYSGMALLYISVEACVCVCALVLVDMMAARREARHVRKLAAWVRKGKRIVNARPKSSSD